MHRVRGLRDAGGLRAPAVPSFRLMAGRESPHFRRSTALSFPYLSFSVPIFLDLQIFCRVTSASTSPSGANRSMVWLLTITAAAGLSLSTIALASELRLKTPLMGWNSYNYYNCHPSESIIQKNAQGLVDLGLSKLGYTYVTPDCGWNANYRDSTTG